MPGNQKCLETTDMSESRSQAATNIFDFHYFLSVRGGPREMPWVKMADMLSASEREAGIGALFAVGK